MNNSNEMRYGVFAASFALLVGLVLAMAGTAEATARSTSMAILDWTATRLSVSPGMDLTFTGKTTVVSADVAANGAQQVDQQVLPGFVTAHAKANYSSGSLSAWGRGDTLEPTTFGPGFISSGGYAASYQGGDAFVQNLPHQTGSFTVSGNGIITLEVPYSLDVRLIADNLEEYAAAVAEALAVLTNSSGARTSKRERILQLVNGVDGSFEEIRTGTLTLSLPFFDGQSGTFMTMAHTEDFVSSVPEPSTLILLSGGVAGLVLLRRARARG